MAPARLWHATTAAVVLAALAVQVGLVWSGASVLVTTDDPPGLAVRLWRFVSYFTIQSNALLLVAAVLLARNPVRDGAGFRALRLAGLVGITVTGVVHWFLLRPILDLAGLSSVTDKALHVVAPVLAVVGWLVFGPRPRIDRAAVGRALVWPVAYIAYTALAGAVSGWYPYPFADVGVLGYPRVLLNGLAIVLGFGLLCLAYGAVERRLPASGVRVTT